MQIKSTELVNKIKQSHQINSITSVIAEWNLNRMSTIKSIVNTRLIGTAILTASTNRVTTSVAHGLSIHDRIQFGTLSGSSTDTNSGVTYWVMSVPTTKSITIGATLAGVIVNITTSRTATAIYEVIEDYDEEMFPIDSIALPDRPLRGNLVARASAKTQVANLGADSWTNNGYEDTPKGARYRTANVDSKYKYWTSPSQSAGSYLNTPASIVNCSPSVVYTTPMLSNKIVVGFESSYAKPSIYSVQITTDGTTWTTISSSPTIPDSGRVELYRQANGTWTTTPDYATAPVLLQGVKIIVIQMNKSQVFFNLIELSLRLERDLTPYVIDWSTSNAMSETSFVTPLGVSSANTGDVALSNIDGQFTNDNAESIYFGLLDKNVEFRISTGINVGTLAAPSFELVRAATMKSGAWGGQDLDTTSVPLSDDTVRLQEIKPNAVFYQSMTVGEIIWRLLDSVGMSNYKYEVVDDDVSTTVPYFWTDGSKTMLEIINELAQATQTAVYFDEFNILQIKTRNIAFGLLKLPAWTFDADTNGVKLPDIVDAKKTNDFEANMVNTSYVTTKLSDVSPSGVPLMENVWEPGGDVVLRAATLKSQMTNTSTFASFDPRYMATWPFTGIIQLEGEFIRYTHKGYCYHSPGGSLVYTWVKSQDEKIALDKRNPALASKNFYNGNLNFGIQNRGLWNSVPKPHSVSVTGYTARIRAAGGPIQAWGGGFIHDKNQGLLVLATNTNFTPNHWYSVLRGNGYDQAPYHYGTRFRFPTSGYEHGTAGLIIGAVSNDAGYYIELNRTAIMGNRAYTNELCFYRRNVDGTITRVAGKGIVMPVSVARWYDMDVTVWYPPGGSIGFDISINGVMKMHLVLPSSGKLSPTLSGRFGLFTRGWTTAQFEYLYASTYSQPDALDDEGYFDRISGGYQSGQLMREWTYSLRRWSRIFKKKRKIFYQKYNQTIIDEFSPVAHEVREFDIKFSKTPVTNSNLYFSNESQVICPEYKSDPFGAKFILANTARVNAVVKGDDTLTFGVDNSVAQQMLIYGRTVNVAEPKVHTVRDELGIRKRGEVAIDISSPWIQTEGEAKSLGSWIALHWSGGNDEVELSVFGNPLIQLGDVVSINYADMNMLAATHRYFVVKVAQSYSSGLSTSLTLRRRTDRVLIA